MVSSGGRNYPNGEDTVSLRTLRCLAALTLTSAASLPAQVVPNATATATVAANPKDVASKAVINLQSVEEYVRVASRGQPRHGFSEREIARTSETFGNIMQIFSTYEARRDSTDVNPTRGINSIQLFNDGSRWWVAGVLWDTERPWKPIPPAFLKNTKSP